MIGHNKRTCGRQSSQKKQSFQKKRTKTISLDKSKSAAEYEKLLEDFQRDRPEQYEFANGCVQSLMDGKNVSVTAEEKTGKRLIMEAIVTILNVNHSMRFMQNDPPKNMFVTALSRKDTKPQFREQEDVYGITSVVATKHDEILREIMKVLSEEGDSKVYIHIDESDYGTGEKQALSKLYLHPDIKRHGNRVKFLTYSATNEECDSSENVCEPDWAFHKFTPPPSYFGARRYLENDLVRDPEKFFDGTSITNQGREIISKTHENCSHPELLIRQRNVIVARITVRGGLDKIRHEMESISKEYDCEVHIFDQDNSFGWGVAESWFPLGRTVINDDDGNFKREIFRPVLIFINQICSRSTELHPTGHRRLYAWHDSRKLCDGFAYNTLSQANGRVKHYRQAKCSDNQILLYVDEDILKIAIGIKPRTNKIKISQRVVTSVTPKYTFAVTYEDKFTDISSVKDPDWQEGNPNGPGRRTEYKDPNGKWCLYDGVTRFFNDSSSTNSATDIYTTWGDDNAWHETLQYESQTSDRYLIRRVKLTRHKTDVTEMKFKTHHRSMYSK